MIIEIKSLFKFMPEPHKKKFLGFVLKLYIRSICNLIGLIFYGIIKFTRYRLKYTHYLIAQKKKIISELNLDQDIKAVKKD